jgi:hypothetical protein
MSQRLASFIASLGTSPAAVSAYKADPETEMEKAGLVEHEKNALRDGNWHAVSELLPDTDRGDRPVGGQEELDEPPPKTGGA